MAVSHYTDPKYSLLAIYRAISLCADRAEYRAKEHSNVFVYMHEITLHYLYACKQPLLDDLLFIMRRTIVILFVSI